MKRGQFWNVFIAWVIGAAVLVLGLLLYLKLSGKGNDLLQIITQWWRGG